jgi:hypothetical protein
MTRRRVASQFAVSRFKAKVTHYDIEVKGQLFQQSFLLLYTWRELLNLCGLVLVQSLTVLGLSEVIYKRLLQFCYSPRTINERTQCQVSFNEAMFSFNNYMFSFNEAIISFIYALMKQCEVQVQIIYVLF